METTSLNQLYQTCCLTGEGYCASWRLNKETHSYDRPKQKVNTVRVIKTFLKQVELLCLAMVSWGTTVDAGGRKALQKCAQKVHSSVVRSWPQPKQPWEESRKIALREWGIPCRERASNPASWAIGATNGKEERQKLEWELFVCVDHFNLLPVKKLKHLFSRKEKERRGRGRGERMHCLDLHLPSSPKYYYSWVSEEDHSYFLK